MQSQLDEKIKKVAVIGPESTGKSWLTMRLANYFKTEYVPEYARQYLDEIDRPYVKDDLSIIARGQLRLESERELLAKELLFCDTNLIVIKIWSDHKYGSTDHAILAQLASSQYDYYLLTNIDLPWEPDPQREHPDMRSFFYEKYHDYLIKAGLPFSVISGLGEERFENALRAVESEC